MAVTFDTEQPATVGVKYDSSSGIWTTISDFTNFDYFDDNATVGDYIAFGGLWRTAWHNLNFNVGTALVADSITLVWEYWGGDHAWNTLTVTDDTNDFTTPGANSVDFDVPDGWNNFPWVHTAAYQTNGYEFWVRCRIAAVTNITEGGANDTTIVSYDDWTMRVNSASQTPATLKTANDGGGWGVVAKTANHYYFTCNLFIGDSSTGDLTIRDEEIVEVGYIGDGGGVYETDSKHRLFKNFVDGTLTVGSLSGADYGTGGTLRCNHSYYTGLGLAGTTNFYGGTLVHWGRQFCIFTGTVNLLASRLTNPLGSGKFYFHGDVSGGEIKDSMFSSSDTSSWIYLYTSDLTIDNLIIGEAKGIASGLSNVTIENVTFPTGKVFGVLNANRVNNVLLNCTSADDWETTLNIDDWSTNNECFVKFTLEMSIIDANGDTISDCSVKIVNGLGTEVFNNTWTGSTDLTGYYGYYSGSAASFTDYNPFTVTISKASYSARTIKYTMDRKKEETEKLSPDGTNIQDSTFYDTTIY